MQVTTASQSGYNDANMAEHQGNLQEAIQNFTTASAAD